MQPKPIVYYGLQQLAGPCSVLLSALAVRQQARRLGRVRGRRATLARSAVQLLPPEACRLDELDKALEQLAHVAPKQRARLVDACAACICADSDVNVAEGELLRAICDMLDCPMPPLVAGQKVSPSFVPSPAPSPA